MKKIIVLVLTAFTFFSCGDEIEFNTPSFKAKKDGNLWEAVTYRANIDNTGVITIVASNNFETITLVAFPADASVCDGVFRNNIGSCYDVVENPSFATLLDVDEVFFSTSNTPNPSEQIYPPAGVINLRDVNLESGTVSGEFYFNAFSNSGLSSVNFNEGFFHNVPLTGTVTTPGTMNVPCDTAQTTVAATLINFNGSMPGDANYEAVCNAYKTALMTQITSCGDTGGATQAIVDGLDCTASALTGGISLMIDGVSRIFNNALTVSTTGTILSFRADDTVNTDYITFDIEQNQTGIDFITNFVANIDDIDFIPSAMSPLGDFTSNTTVNTSTNFDATFSGGVADSDTSAGTPERSLTMGVIDINY